MTIPYVSLERGGAWGGVNRLAENRPRRRGEPDPDPDEDDDDETDEEEEG